jgi:hypothetical protein
VTAGTSGGPDGVESVCARLDGLDEARAVVDNRIAAQRPPDDLGAHQPASVSQVFDARCPRR